MKIWHLSLTNTWRGIKMIRYSNTPDKNAKVITDSPTAPIKTTRDFAGLNDEGKPSQKTRDLQDLDAEDINDN